MLLFGDIDVTVDPRDLETLISNGNAALAGCTVGTGVNAELECASDESPRTITGTGTVTASTISYNADINAYTPTSTAVDAEITVELENSWAVRALATSLTASVVAGGGDFTNATITPTAPVPSLTLTDGDNIGDLQFDVDLDALTGVTASDTLTITVVAP